MSAAIALWSLQVPAGKKIVHVPQADIHITGACLDATLADKDGRTSVKLTYVSPQQGDEIEDEEKPPAKSTTILASLTPGKIEQAHLDIILSEEEPVEFEVVGENSIYLSGNYILQPSDFPAGGLSDDEEEDFDLREVSSDVEVNEDDLEIPSSEEEVDVSHRFEEIIEVSEKDEKAEAPSKKRPHDGEEAEGKQKLSKRQRKKLQQQKEAAGADTKGAEKVKKDEKKVVKKEEKKEDKKEEKKKEEKKEEKTVKAKESPSKPKAELETRPSGLQIKDVKVGSGKIAKSGDLVSLRYIGKLQNGKVFDSNTKGKPFTFRVGAGEVIKGWDEGIQGMKINSERLLIVPPKLGYGNRKQADIPASSTLHFEVKLLEIK